MPVHTTPIHRPTITTKTVADNSTVKTGPSRFKAVREHAVTWVQGVVQTRNTSRPKMGRKRPR